MIKKLSYLFFLLITLAACSDEADYTPEMQTPAAAEQEQTEKGFITLEVPICWSPAVNDAEKVANRLGDPGINDEVPTPSNIYIFTWMRNVNNNDATNPDYLLYFDKRENLTKTDWAEVTGDPDTYQLTGANKFNIKLPTPYKMDSYSHGSQIGRTYAIATGEGCYLSDAQIKAITSYDITAGKSIPSATNVETTLKAGLLNTTGWTSDNYRDLYSTPHNDATEYFYHKRWFDDRNYQIYNLKNGYIVYSDEMKPDEATVFHANVHLYHAAAKIDFTWEIPAAQHDALAIKSITATNLPSMCKVFDPTQNPAIEAGTNPAQSFSLPINPGNRWIGREYIFAPQPGDGKISYTVSFEDLDPSDSITKDDVTRTEPKPSLFSSVFTGWFRIIATVK